MLFRYSFFAGIIEPSNEGGNIITALVAGVGMCLSMKVIGNGSTAMFVLGVIVGIIGLLGMGVNYPIYKKMLAQGKQKYAFEIMELAKEISEK